MERTLRGRSEEVHEELKTLCERFERRVEQARAALLESVTPHGFYELGGLAAACSDALARFRRTRSRHEERYEALCPASQVRRRNPSPFKTAETPLIPHQGAAELCYVSPGRHIRSLRRGTISGTIGHDM